MDKLLKVVAVSFALALVSGCSGSSSKSVRNTSSNPPPSTTPPVASNPGSGSTQATVLEGVIQDSANVVGGVGNTVQVLGATISQVDLPVVGTLTDGAGNIVTHVGGGVNALSVGLRDGLGNLSENDNAIGTTLGGVTSVATYAGYAVSEVGSTVTSLNTLPVLAQLDEASGVLTTLGGTVDTLGLVVTDVGDFLTLAFVDENGLVSDLTTQLTAVVRPLIINVDGVVKTVGEAIVITPAVSGLIGQVGSGVVVLGEQNFGQDNVLLASAQGVVQGVGQLLVNSQGNLSVGSTNSGLELLNVGGLVAGGVSGNLLGDLLNGGVLSGQGNLLGQLLSQDVGVVVGLTQTLNGLTGGLLSQQGGLSGGLLQLDGGLLSGVTGSLDGVTGGGLLVLDNGGGLVGGVIGTVEGLSGGLLQTDNSGLLGGVVGTVEGLTGRGLHADNGGLVSGVIDTTDVVTGGLVGGVVSSVDGVTGGLVSGVVNTVDGLTAGLVQADNGGLVSDVVGVVDGLTSGSLGIQSNETGANQNGGLLGLGGLLTVR